MSDGVYFVSGVHSRPADRFGSPRDIACGGSVSGVWCVKILGLNVASLRFPMVAAAVLACLSVGGSPQPGCAAGDAAPGGRLKVGLALGGGGTRGAAHVGVLRVLQQEGIPVDMIAGTSMGAIVGGFYAAGLPVSDIESKFQKPAIMKNYMTVPLFVRFLAVPAFAVPHLFGWHPYDGFYFGNKLRNYLNSCLPEDKREIEKLNIPFHAMCTNLVNGEPYVISRGHLARAMQASSAIPVLRRPVPFEDALLVDGAVVDNVPVDAARAMGADIVIAVDVDEHLMPVDREKFRKIGSVGHRVEQIYLSRADAQQLKLADIVIHPKVDGIGILSLKAKDAREAIRAGEEAARAALPAIRARLGVSGAETVLKPQSDRAAD